MCEGALGIIGCYGVSDQILHLVKRDEEIDTLFVVENPEGLRFARKLRERLIDKELILVAENEIPKMPQDQFSILLWLNPEDLHNTPTAIQLRQEEVLSILAPIVDSIFFCYGLCRSPEQRIMKLISRTTVPVNFLMDACGEIVDDCFAAILGGREVYLQYMLRHKGTLFATTGYVEAWKRNHEPMDIESLVNEVEELKTLLEAMEYRCVLKLDDEVGDTATFEKDVRAFAMTFDLELEGRKCWLRVFDRSYDIAKGRINRGRISQLEERQALDLELAENAFHDRFISWESGQQREPMEAKTESQARSWTKDRSKAEDEQKGERLPLSFTWI